MKEAIILYLLETINTIKIHHWNTYSYAAHKSLGDLYDELGETIDEFVEVMMGKYGRPDYPSTFTLELQKPEDVNPTEALKSCAEYLINLSDELDPRADTDLLNLRDEMLGQINQTIYLLTLTK